MLNVKRARDLQKDLKEIEKEKNEIKNFNDLKKDFIMIEEHEMKEIQFERYFASLDNNWGHPTVVLDRIEQKLDLLLIDRGITVIVERETVDKAYRYKFKKQKIKKEIDLT